MGKVGGFIEEVFKAKLGVFMRFNLWIRSIEREIEVIFRFVESGS